MRQKLKALTLKVLTHWYNPMREIASTVAVPIAQQGYGLCILLSPEWMTNSSLGDALAHQLATMTKLEPWVVTDYDFNRVQADLKTFARMRECVQERAKVAVINCSTNTIAANSIELFRSSRYARFCDLIIYVTSTVNENQAKITLVKSKHVAADHEAYRERVIGLPKSDRNNDFYFTPQFWSAREGGLILCSRLTAR